MMPSSAARTVALILNALFAIPVLLTAKELAYECTDPPLEVTFTVAGGHYSGVVTGGNLFLQPDISDAPIVRWKKASAGKFYTLIMLDFDGNANRLVARSGPFRRKRSGETLDRGKRSGRRASWTGLCGIREKSGEWARSSAVVSRAAYPDDFGSIWPLFIRAGKGN